MPSAVVIGLNIVDVLVRLPHSISPGGKHEVDDLLVTGGAPAGNSACGLAALGIDTAFVGWLGDDALSAIARAELLRCGVRDRLIKHDPAASPGVGVVEIDPATGDRTVFYSLKGHRPLDAVDVPEDAIRRADLLLVDGYCAFAVERALKVAADGGVLSVADIEAGDPETMRRIIALASDPVLPLEAARTLTGTDDAARSVERLVSMSRGRAVVTDGANGCWAATDAGVIHQRSFAVDAVDTTGCGDAFHAAYAVARVHAQPMERCIEFAALFASRVATTLGARTDLPTFTTLAETLPHDASPELAAYISEHALENSTAQ